MEWHQVAAGCLGAARIQPWLYYSIGCDLPVLTSLSTNASAGSASKYDKLEALKKLLDSGALTQSEFDAEKTKILAEQ